MRTYRNTADQMRTMPVGLYDNGGCAFGDDLYFVSTDDGFCKIGRTASVPSRLSTLQNANPRKIKVELTLPGMGWSEKVWHTAFAHLRAGGEWFRCEDELGAAINAAESGEEWIATLRSPVTYLSDADWRERVADREEMMLERQRSRMTLSPAIEAEIARLEV